MAVQPTRFIVSEPVEAPTRGGLVKANPVPFHDNEHTAWVKALGDELDDGVEV